MTPLDGSRTTRRQGRGAIVGALALALALAGGTLAGSSGDLGPDRLLQWGEQIYRTGILPDGRHLQAVIGRDVKVEGASAACTNCHRASGWGSSEGGLQAPPVVARTLFQPVTGGHLGAAGYRQKGPGTRSAYTLTTLERAIRRGVNPDGRLLRAPMPRYDLSAANMHALTAYLSTLGETPDPGVDASLIRLATIVAGPVPETRRRALLDVLHAFQRAINTDVRRETMRRERAGWVARWWYEGYRHWDLTTWDLQGSPSTWPAQLERLYQEAPVFAVLSGVGEGPWQPVHDFCQGKRLPCFFPVTDEPSPEADDGYTFYFSRGATLEGRAVARYLEAADRAQPSTVIQLYRPQGRGAVAARALRQAVEPDPAIRLVDTVVRSGPVAKPLRDALRRSTPKTVVLWLETDDLAALGRLSEVSTAAAIVLPSWALAAPLPEPLRDHPGRVLASFPYALPTESHAGLDRALGWMRMRRVEVTDQKVQSGAFFAASVVGDALKELRGRFSREYLMENVEHMVDRSVTTSVYSRLSLAPGQRYATTRCSIVDATHDADGRPRLAEVTSWIEP